MPCAHPTPAAWDRLAGTIQLWPPVGEANIQLPCGTCILCKKSRALEWARRAQDEASTWEHNSFLTLTYDARHLPYDSFLEPTHLQAFIKRLRAHHTRANPALLRAPGSRLRYLACGEYGETNARPHYHLCLFNCDFADSYLVGSQLKESPLVAKLWPKGGHRIGTLTGASANYVAQYTLKKIGSDADQQVTADGAIRPAPFIRASLKPFIGATWIEKFHRDVTHGYLITDGHKVPVPRAYQRWLRDATPELAEQSSYNRHRYQTAKQHPGSAGDANPYAGSAGSGATATPGLSDNTNEQQKQRRQLQLDADSRARCAAEAIEHSKQSHFSRRHQQ